MEICVTRVYDQKDWVNFPRYEDGIFLCKHTENVTTMENFFNFYPFESSRHLLKNPHVPIPLALQILDYSLKYKSTIFCRHLQRLNLSEEYIWKIYKASTTFVRRKDYLLSMENCPEKIFTLVMNQKWGLGAKRFMLLNPKTPTKTLKKMLKKIQNGNMMDANILYPLLINHPNFPEDMKFLHRLSM